MVVISQPRSVGSHKGVTGLGEMTFPTTAHRDGTDTQGKLAHPGQRCGPTLGHGNHNGAHLPRRIRQRIHRSPKKIKGEEEALSKRDGRRDDLIHVK